MTAAGRKCLTRAGRTKTGLALLLGVTALVPAAVRIEACTPLKAVRRNASIEKWRKRQRYPRNSRSGPTSERRHLYRMHMHVVSSSRNEPQAILHTPQVNFRIVRVEIERLH